MSVQSIGSGEDVLSSLPASPVNQKDEAEPKANAKGAQSSSASTTTAGSRVRRRNRMITSCLECRRRKLKCDKSHPCFTCSKFNRECVFLAPSLDSASQLKLMEIKEKMGSLERVLEQDVAKNGFWRELRKAQQAGQTSMEENIDFAPIPDDERELEPTPLAVDDAVYEEDADGDLMDLGVRFGKLRLTDRLGGFFRPKISDEVLQFASSFAVCLRLEDICVFERFAKRSKVPRREKRFTRASNSAHAKARRSVRSRSNIPSPCFKLLLLIHRRRSLSD